MLKAVTIKQPYFLLFPCKQTVHRTQNRWGKMSSKKGKEKNLKKRKKTFKGSQGKKTFSEWSSPALLSKIKLSLPMTQ